MSLIIKTVQFLTNELIVLLFSIVLFIFLWFQYKYTYWSRKGVIGPRPVFPFGNIRDVVKRKTQFFQLYSDYYGIYKHLPYIGMYSFSEPMLSINDIDVAKLVLIKDFEHFTSHGFYSGGAGDPLAGHLFNLHGQTWKKLRYKISPAFSPGKLKSMYPLVDKIANESLSYVDHLTEKGEQINFSEFYAKYSMEIIGSVGYGVECNGFKNPDSEFCLRGHEYFEPKWYWSTLRGLSFFVPNFFKLLRLRRMNPEIIDFFYNLVKKTVEYRVKQNYERSDFLQTLIELRNGKLDNEEAETKENMDDLPFTMKDIASNALLYMFAGYETSATTGQFAAYELARNRHIQARARQEVLAVLARHGGRCTYEAQNEMVYLNMVIDETLRMYPPMRALFRRCTKDYKLPHSDLLIEEGTLIFIPIAAIQMDPEIFPKPEVFDPERFLPELKAKMHPCQWMPFGEGPRKCLGLRQGYIQTKMALVKILQKYELFVDDRTRVPLKLKASSLASAVDGGVWLKLKKLQH